MTAETIAKLPIRHRFANALIVRLASLSVSLDPTTIVGLALATANSWGAVP